MKAVIVALRLIVAGITLCPSLLACQQPIPEEAARKNLIQQVKPVYPPIAKAARVQGDVVIAATIDKAGAVISERVVSGPAMLQQAALDAVKKWTFKPFEESGAAASVTTTLKISFQIDKPGEGPTKEQEEASQAWFALSDKCRNRLNQPNTEDAVSACKQALDMALRAQNSNSSDLLGLMLSHEYYGHALLAAGRANEALAEENEAINVARRCLTDTDQEFAMPIFWRALAEHQLGQSDAALADYTLAEQTHRKAIAHLPDMKKRYGQVLAAILNRHAALLDQLGRSAEAVQLRNEAASL